MAGSSERNVCVMSGVNDIPSAHSFFDSGYVRSWLETTTVKHPERSAMFDQFVAEISAVNSQKLTVLELGSGPGVLAEQVLAQCPVQRYWLVDFSPQMHQLAHERLGDDDRTIYVQADFKSPSWTEAISERVEVVVTMQALHELRHSSRSHDLYRQLTSVAEPGGLVLICDHLRPPDDGRPLYMSVDEHLSALEAGGITNPSLVLTIDQLGFFRGRFPA
jgi:SAM-dependent methyltransferase